MFWNIVIGILSYAIQLALTPKPPNAKPKSLEDFQAPTAEEGREIPVVFGTSDIADPNVTWYGDLKRQAIKGARRYGLFGPRQVLGYKYSLGMQMGLCHGPADKITSIRVGDKLAWSGISTGGRIHINKSGLFGGDQSEGGIAGDVDICMGAPDQGQNDYLASKLGATISAFRGVLTVVLRQVYLGTSNYIKPWEFRVQRILKKSDGTEQWYPSKAAIGDKEVSTTEPGVELGTTAIGGEDALDTKGDYAAGSWVNTAWVWHLPDGAKQTITWTGGNLFGGSVHITDFAELVIRTGGDIHGVSHTSLEFRDIANPESISQSIDLHTIVTDAGGSDINGGFYMDDVTVGDSTYALVIAPTRILLERGNSGWSYVSSAAVMAGPIITSVSMGPTYAYGRLNGSFNSVSLMTWNGSWAETTVTLPGYSGYTGVAALHYDKDRNEVIAVAPNGDIFVYNETLTTLLRWASMGRSLSSSVALASSKRMSTEAGSIIFALKTTDAGPIDQIYVMRTSDLTVLDSIHLSDTSYVHKTNAYSLMPFNPDYGSVIVGGSSYEVFWPVLATVFDMNPSHIIRECLTDTNWGMGYNEADIDDVSFTACADTFYSELFGLSLRWSQEEEIQNFVSTILAHIDAYLYVSRSTGKFVLKAIRNDYDIDLIPVLTEDDVVEWTEIDHRQPSEAVSSVLVKFYYREKRKNGAHLVTNIAQAMQATKVQPATKQYDGINRSDLAIRVGTRDVIALGSGLTSGRLVAKRTIENLNPGDPFRLVASRHDLSGEVMRVADLNFGDGRQNKIGLKFFQDVFNLGAAVLVDNSGSTWEPPTNDPKAVSPRLVWEMPYREMRQMVGDADLASLLSGDAGAGLLQVAGVAPSGDALNADVKIDTGAGYAGTEQMDFAPGGFINGALAVDATSVTLSTGSGVDATAIGLLATIGDGSRAGTEVVRIDAVAGNTLTIGRGCLDTVPLAHGDGTAFVLFDDLSTSDFEAYTDGDSINVKLLTNTGSGQLSAAPINSFDFSSRGIRPLRPSNISVNGIGYGLISSDGVTDLATEWYERNRLIELDSPLAWGDATVTAESGQTTIIEVLDPTAASVVTTHSGLTGLSFSVPVSSFGGNASGWIQVGSERDGYREWTAYKLQVVFNAVSTASFILTGNAAGLSLNFPLSVSTGTFSLTGNAAPSNISMPAATGSFALTGNAAALQFSAGLVAGIGSFTLTGVAVVLNYATGERDAALSGLMVNDTGTRQAALPDTFFNH